MDASNLEIWTEGICSDLAVRTTLEKVLCHSAVGFSTADTSEFTKWDPANGMKALVFVQFSAGW